MHSATHPCRNHDIYRQYTELVEQQLEKFLADEGLRPEDVCKACERAMSAPGESGHLTCLDYLNACTEYDSFIDLAFDHACMLGLGEPDENETWLPDLGDRS